MPPTKFSVGRRIVELDPGRGFDVTEFRILSIEKIVDADKGLQSFPNIGELCIEGIIRIQSDLVGPVADRIAGADDIGLGIQ